MKTFQLSEEIVTGVLQYLSQRPYAEVQGLVSAMSEQLVNQVPPTIDHEEEEDVSVES